VESPYPEVVEVCWMAHVQFHGDESGKFQNSPYVAFCGFLGNSDQWAKFVPAWRAARIKHQVPPIHVSAMLHPTEKNGWLPISQRYGDKWPDQCQQILNEFSAIIAQEGLICSGTVIDATAFESLSLPMLQERTIGDPHYLAFETTMVGALEKVLWGDTNATMGVVMDDDEEKAILCYRLYRLLREHNTKAKERLSGICFGSDDLYPGIQAADMLAHESRRLMIEAAPPSERFAKLTCNGKHQPILLSAERLEAWEKELREEYERGV
jgi:hypothetical protein